MAVVNKAFAKVLLEAEPVTYWKPLALARPIDLILAPEPVFEVPLEDDNVSNRISLQKLGYFNDGIFKVGKQTSKIDELKNIFYNGLDDLVN